MQANLGPKSRTSSSHKANAVIHHDKVAKTNADKAQLCAESVERHFGIESKHFDSNHFMKSTNA